MHSILVTFTIFLSAFLISVDCAKKPTRWQKPTDPNAEQKKNIKRFTQSDYDFNQQPEQYYEPEFGGTTFLENEFEQQFYNIQNTERGSVEFKNVKYERSGDQYDEEIPDAVMDYTRSLPSKVLVAFRFRFVFLLAQLFLTSVIS